MKKLFHLSHGIIASCDIETIDEYKRLIVETTGIEGVVGYKIGAILGLSYGLEAIMTATKSFSDLPVIYDHQKASTDIPDIGESFARVCKKAGLKGVIIFPQSGPVTEMAFIKSIIENSMIPIVGGDMTHPKYLEKDGGFIRDDAPLEMYGIAAENNVEYFIVPGNKPTEIEKYNDYLSQIVDNPKFCMPGIGKQGGDIQSAFKATKNRHSYAIIGSAIYRSKNIRETTIRFCEIALKFE